MVPKEARVAIRAGYYKPLTLETMQTAVHSLLLTQPPYQVRYYTVYLLWKSITVCYSVVICLYTLRYFFNGFISIFFHLFPAPSEPTLNKTFHNQPLALFFVKNIILDLQWATRLTAEI